MVDGPSPCGGVWWQSWERQPPLMGWNIQTVGRQANSQAGQIHEIHLEGNLEQHGDKVLVVVDHPKLLLHEGKCEVCIPPKDPEVIEDPLLSALHPESCTGHKC